LNETAWNVLFTTSVGGTGWNERPQRFSGRKPVTQSLIKQVRSVFVSVVAHNVPTAEKRG
jgi:hypothetical protein